MSHPNDNPWQDERGQQNHNPYSTYQDQTQPPAGQSNAYSQQAHQENYAPPNHPPPQQQRYYGSGNSAPQANEALHSNPTQSQYQPPSHDYSSNPNTNPWGTSASAGQTSHLSSNDDLPPNLPPRRSATDLALPQGQDRSHQIEVMQSYEAAGRKDEHDQNVEVLQREFPKIDGSLIAAIYGDSQSLSATREMLGELDTQ